MKLVKFLAVMLTVAATAACSNVQYNPDVNFSEYSTWSWRHHTSDEGLPVLYDGLKEEIVKSFEEKGYRFVENPFDADFLAQMHLTETVGKRYSAIPTPKVSGHYNSDGTYQVTDPVAAKFDRSARPAPARADVTRTYESAPSNNGYTTTHHRVTLALYQKTADEAFWSNNVRAGLEGFPTIAKKLNKFPSK